MPAKKNTPAKPVKKLNKSQMRRTKGGVRKAGGTQQEYLTVKLDTATISGVST
jgi:type VI protein secretion system component Hcp